MCTYHGHNGLDTESGQACEPLEEFDLRANWHNIFGQNCALGAVESRCSVAPAPELQEKINKAMAKLRKDAPDGMAGLLSLRERRHVGFNDGLLVPGTEMPLGTPPDVARNSGLERAPLTGTVRVAVILVEFPDKAFAAGGAARFNNLFFSNGVIPTGSVKEYFTEVTNGLVTISGAVLGPYMMPNTLAEYANGQSGTGNTTPNARDLARDAALAADPHINFGPYDNDGDGYVDAFVVVHAGGGAEQSGSGGDIWSHKWVMRSVLSTDSTKLYSYLTIPDNARLGVCAHELGHLLFGFPDLYDTDYSSSGIGNWCLMAGGSWNNGGDTPAHPSAWCKANQGWATVSNVTSNGVQSIPDVKASHQVHRLWKDGAAGQEYFLVENRQKTGFDAHIPAGGLLIWHIDDAIAGNSDENHPRVALAQADGLNQLKTGANRGDAGDCYPGSTGNVVFDNGSNPSSKSYAGSNTCVSVTAISAPAATMSADLRVRCGKTIIKEIRDKGYDKRLVHDKRFSFEKRLINDKVLVKEKPDFDKRPEKPITDKAVGLDKNTDKFSDKLSDWPGGRPGGGLGNASPADMQSRLAALEAAMEAISPFIDASLRPDLEGTAYLGEDDLSHMRDEAASSQADAKRLLDSPRRA